MTEFASERPEPSPRTEVFLEIVGAASSRDLRDLPDVTRLGRSRDNDVQLLDARVSKRHAEIHRDGRRYAVRDLQAKSGLYVNGQRIREQLLQDGDVITFGEFELPRVVFREPRPRTAATPANTGDLQSLARFLEFTRVFAGGAAVTEVLDRVVDMAMEITGAERGFAILLGEDGELVFEVARKRGVGALARTNHRVSETIVRQVLSSRSPRVVSDISFEQELAEAQSIVSLQLGSAVAMPLWRIRLEPDSTGDVFGVLYLDSRHRRDAFSQLDLGLLENLARDASAAMENARLLREAEDKLRMEREIRTAREVQAALLPESFWSEPHFTVSGTCVPCLDLGGDYIDQFRLPCGRAGYVVADVCGKGIGAALLAAALQGCLAAEMTGDRPLGKTVERVNRVLCGLAPTGDFISMICCALSPDGELTFVNAGHCPLLLVTASGIEHLVTEGVALGVLESRSYREGTAQMQPGDLAVLYTDGVVEADGPGGELYGEERLESVLAGAHGASADTAAQSILDSVAAFRADLPVTDDITLLVVRYHGARAEDESLL